MSSNGKPSIRACSITDDVVGDRSALLVAVLAALVLRQARVPATEPV